MMSIKKNVPSQIDLFKAAARKQNNKIRNQEVLSKAPKILFTIALFASGLVATYFLTQLLLANRISDSTSPHALIVAIAIIGALLIVAAAAFIALTIRATIASLGTFGHDTTSVAMSIVGIIVVATIAGLIVTLYLLLFFGA